MNTKILIVDDELDICYFLSHNLTKRKFQTFYTHSLADAERNLAELNPSILLLDNHLPDGFGINFISTVRSKHPAIKIIMLTAHDTPQDRSKAYANGADFFLSKPFTIQEVNKVIDLVGSSENM
jgi:two-component system, OmpR family, response regulator